MYSQRKGPTVYYRNVFEQLLCCHILIIYIPPLDINIDSLFVLRLTDINWLYQENCWDSLSLLDPFLFIFWEKHPQTFVTVKSENVFSILTSSTYWCQRQFYRVWYYITYCRKNHFACINVIIVSAVSRVLWCIRERSIQFYSYAGTNKMVH